MFGQLRTATQQDKIFFCLSDVTKALDLQVNKVKNRLKRDGWNTIPTVSLTTNQHGKTTEQVNVMTYIDQLSVKGGAK